MYPEDLFHAPIGTMDAFARGLESAANMFRDGKFEKTTTRRSTDWNTPSPLKTIAGRGRRVRVLLSATARVIPGGWGLLQAVRG